MDIKVGDKSSVKRKISIEDIDMFAKVTGDYNAVHVDDVKAKNSIFGERIAHGMLSAGFISAVLGTRLPGEGTIYLSQSLNFRKAVKIGDEIITTCEVIEVINPTKGIIRLSTVCVNQNGENVLDGEAVVKYLPLEE